MTKKWILGLLFLSCSGLFGAEAFLDMRDLEAQNKNSESTNKRVADQDGNRDRKRSLKVPSGLFEKCEDGDFEGASELLKHGADVNEEGVIQDRRNDYYFCSSLYASTRRNDERIVNLLLEGKACPNKGAKQYNGKIYYSPLYKASMEGYEKIVELLIKYNVDVNKEIKEGSEHIPVHIALEFRKSKIAEILLEKGAYLDDKRKNDLITSRFFSEDVGIVMRKYMFKDSFEELSNYGSGL